MVMIYHRPPPPPLLRPPPQEPDDEPLLPLLAALARVLRSVMVRMTMVLRATAMRRKSLTEEESHIQKARLFVHHMSGVSDHWI